MEVDEVLEFIRGNKNLIDKLRECSGIRTRCLALQMLFFPDLSVWDQLSRRRLIWSLSKIHSIELGVCPHYLIEGENQYCLFGGVRMMCTCSIPQAYCVFRDKEGKPKYPGFNFFFSW